MIVENKLEMVVDVVLIVAGVAKSISRLVLDTVGVWHSEPEQIVSRNEQGNFSASRYLVAQGRLSMIRWTKYSCSILYPTSLLALASHLLFSQLGKTLH